MTVLFATLLLAACGGGGGDDDGVASLGGNAGTEEDGTTATTLSEEEQEEALLDWAACMRSEGIDMPDPQIDANGRGGIMITGEANVDDDGEDGASQGAPPDFEAFEAATEECGDPPFFGGELTEEDRKEMEERALAFAECMRENGIEDFPDPDFSQRGPGAGPGTRERRIGEDEGSGDGPQIAIAGPFGEFQMDDPEEIAAFETCQETGGFGPPGGGGPGPVGAVGAAPQRSTAST